MKPYFLPLFKEYYLKIKEGSQDCEIKPLDHRGWNTKNIFRTRSLNVSNGYQKKGRIIKRILKIKVTGNLKTSGVPAWHIEAVEKIYGKRDLWLIAYF